VSEFHQNDHEPPKDWAASSECLGGQPTDDQALRLSLQERMRLEDQQGRYPLGTGPTLCLLRDAEDTRFELVRACTQHAFQACALGH
jgi:hypothetical protein